MLRNRHGRRRRPSNPSRPRVEPCEARLLLSDAAAILPAIGSPALAQPRDFPSISSSFDEFTAQAAIVRSAYDVDGAGLTAAVIDTGVLADHPALGGFGPESALTVGHDFAESDDDPSDPNRGSPHGTAVAGLIASRDPEHPGVAPGAEIAALRVFGDDGRGSFEAIANALQWVVDHHDEHNISVVNISISDGGNFRPPFLPSNPTALRVGGLIRDLVALDIPVVSAAGNAFAGRQGMGFTAIVKETISVSGLDETGRIASDAQRLGSGLGGPYATDLLAPARDVRAPWIDDGFAALDGTSFAAPLVTGTVLLLQDLYLDRFGELPSVDQINTWLEAGAVEVSDSVSGIVLKTLDPERAAAQVPVPSASEPDVVETPDVEAEPQTPAVPEAEPSESVPVASDPTPKEGVPSAFVEPPPFPVVVTEPPPRNQSPSPSPMPEPGSPAEQPPALDPEGLDAVFGTASEPTDRLDLGRSALIREALARSRRRAVSGSGLRGPRTGALSEGLHAAQESQRFVNRPQSFRTERLATAQARRAEWTAWSVNARWQPSRLLKSIGRWVPQALRPGLGRFNRLFPMS